MKVLFFYIVATLSTLSLASRFSTDDEKEAAISKIPPCGFNCFLPVLGKYECPVSNLTQLSDCLCLNLEAEKTISECILLKCNYTDLVLVEKAQQVICEGQPRPSLQPQLLGTTIGFGILVIIFVALRCWSRYTISRQFWWDDWFVLMSAFLLLILQAITVWGVHMGFGLHVWNVDSDLNVALYQFMWIYEIFYVVVQSTTKVSVLLLYYRIFPQAWLRKTLFALMGFMCIHFLVFLLLIINFCTPIAFVYDHSLKGTCLDSHAIVLVGAIFTIIEDLTFIVLPIPSILKLHLKPSKKLAVILVMSVGLIAVIASLIRLKYVVHFYYSIDQNWDDVGIAILSMVETSLSIVCVCFPAVKLLMNKYLPNYFSSEGGGVTLSLGGTGSSSSRRGLLGRMKIKISSKFSSRKSSRKSSSRPVISIPWISTRAPHLPSIAGMGSHIELEKGRDTMTTESTINEERG